MNSQQTQDPNDTLKTNYPATARAITRRLTKNRATLNQRGTRSFDRWQTKIVNLFFSEILRTRDEYARRTIKKWQDGEKGNSRKKMFYRVRNPREKRNGDKKTRKRTRSFFLLDVRLQFQVQAWMFVIGVSRLVNWWSTCGQKPSGIKDGGKVTRAKVEKSRNRTRTGGSRSMHVRLPCTY